MSRQHERIDTTSADLSILMLRQVLDGASYAGVGRTHGVTRTAVERRIKDVARQLSRAVGIEGLNEEGIAFVRRLRANRLAILEALEAFDPEHLVQIRQDKQVRVYSNEEILAAAGRVRAYSNQPQRDVAMFLLLFATGIRPLEVARLKVVDYLQMDGHVRRVSVLSAEAAIGGMARPLHFASARLDQAMQAYLQERVGSSESRHIDGYLSLNPDQSLFLAADGKGFAITTYVQEGQQRYLCRPVLETYRKIFRYAALPGGTPRAVRATVAARLYARGADDVQVGLLLGISHRSTVRQLFPRAKPTLAQLIEDLI